MAVQIVKPIDTKLPMNPVTVEEDTTSEDEFAWVSLLCCSYTNYVTHIDIDWEEDIDV